MARQHNYIALVTTGSSYDSVAPAKYILTLLDIFTRLVIAVPIASKSTNYVAEALITYAFAVHGRPQSRASIVDGGLTALYRRWDVVPVTAGGWRA